MHGYLGCHGCRQAQSQCRQSCRANLLVQQFLANSMRQRVHPLTCAVLVVLQFKKTVIPIMRSIGKFDCASPHNLYGNVFQNYTKLRSSTMHPGSCNIAKFGDETPALNCCKPSNVEDILATLLVDDPCPRSELAEDGRHTLLQIIKVVPKFRQAYLTLMVKPKHWQVDSGIFCLSPFKRLVLPNLFLPKLRNERCNSTFRCLAPIEFDKNYNKVKSRPAKSSNLYCNRLQNPDNPYVLNIWNVMHVLDRVKGATTLDP